MSAQRCQRYSDMGAGPRTDVAAAETVVPQSGQEAKRGAPLSSTEFSSGLSEYLVFTASKMPMSCRGRAVGKGRAAARETERPNSRPPPSATGETSNTQLPTKRWEGQRATAPVPIDSGQSERGSQTRASRRA